MATDAEWMTRIGARIQELRNLKGWSLTELAIKTRDRLSKSRISNYEQGIRMIGPEEATILAEALEEAPAHVMCLDDGMPALSKAEASLINDLRALPENHRLEYGKRIAALAQAYKQSVPDERVLETDYNPDKRPEPIAPLVKPPGKHDN